MEAAYYNWCHRFLPDSLLIQNVYESLVRLKLGYMVSNATLNNISVISWRSVLLVEETGVSGENHRPVASH